MRSICSYCKILFDVKPPYENDQETHGICDEDFEIVKHNMDIEHKKRFEKGMNEDDFK